MCTKNKNMINLDLRTFDCIKNYIEGKKYLRLTIGVAKENNSIVKVYTEDGEIVSPKKYFYEVGSITKTFTASLLSKYIFESKIFLNDSIQKHINELPANVYFPEIRKLATHSSGYSGSYISNRIINAVKQIINYYNENSETINPFTGKLGHDEMKKIIKKNKVKNKDYSYLHSDFGFGVLGYILGNISGNGYWSSMTDLIQNEFNLKDTYLGTIKNKNIHGYNNKNKDCGNWEWNTSDFFAPSGCISSTAEDLLKYAMINMNEEKPYLYLCQKKHAGGTRKFNMGLGWQINKEDEIIWNTGKTGYSSSFIGFDKEKNTTVVILSNYKCNYMNTIGFSLLNHLNYMN
jgi:CubicO group peptidase (beta-lactamase class C family)